MAALTLIAPVGTGTTVTGTTPSATDTIALSVLGEAGCNLRVQTTGTLTNLTISDAGSTPAGNALSPATTAVTLSATQIKTIYISPKRADLATGLVTITASGALTGVTYELYSA